ncbi:MAG: hypothetical protein HQL58_12430 [Magnetococcales bacterium]|nr:hypothetical protein [Magnetococcales bacterium]
MTDKPNDMEQGAAVIRQQLVEWWPLFARSRQCPDWMGGGARERRKYAKWLGLFVDLMQAEYQQLLPGWQIGSVQSCLTRHFMMQVDPAEITPNQVYALLGAFLQFAQQQQWLAVEQQLIDQLQTMAQQQTTVAQLIEWPGRPQANAAGQKRRPRELPQLGDQLHQETRKIAAQISRNRPPIMADEYMAFLESCPELVFEILATLEDLFTQETMDDALVTAYLIQLSYLLDSVRYDVDRQYDWAVRLIADFQDELVGLVQDRRLSGTFITTLFSLMNECRLTLEPRLIAAYQELMTEETVGQVFTPESFSEAVEQLLQEHGSDPFVLCLLLEELIRAMPGETRSFALSESCRIGGQDGMSDAVALLILSRDESIRNTALESLLFHAASVTPSALRRLIVMRNWLPEQVRKSIDLITRAARRKKIVCAQWPESDKIISCHSMLIDGSGSHGIMIVSQSGRSYRWSVILTRQLYGFADVWSEGGVAKKEINIRMQQLLSQDAGPISRSLVDSMIRHHLHVALEQGEIPPPLLLQVAEVMGATDWLPQPMDLQQQLQQLRQTGHDGTGEMEPGLPLLLQHHRLNIMDSWFEDSGAVAEFLAKTRIRRESNLISQLLQRFYEPQRQRWAEMMIWAALWFQQQKQGNGADHLHQAWSIGLAQTAQQILDGLPLDQIGMMLFMARQTADSLRRRRR